MRHLVGFVLGVIVAPLLLYALGWGVDVAAATWTAGSGTLSTEGIAAAGALAISGVAIALLARGLPRLGALVVGLAFVALNVLNLMYLPAIEATLRPWGPARLDWAGAHELLGTGIIGMIGVVLVVTALVPRRQRRAPARADDEEYLSFITSGPEPAWSSGQEGSAVPAGHGGATGYVQTPGAYSQPGGGATPPAAR